MSKKSTKLIKKLPIKEQPTKLNMAFEQFINKAINTPVKNSKINKK